MRLENLLVVGALVLVLGSVVVGIMRSSQGKKDRKRSANGDGGDAAYNGGHHRHGDGPHDGDGGLVDSGGGDSSGSDGGGGDGGAGGGD